MVPTKLTVYVPFCCVTASRLPLLARCWAATAPRLPRAPQPETASRTSSTGRWSTLGQRSIVPWHAEAWRASMSCAATNCDHLGQHVGGVAFKPGCAYRSCLPVPTRGPSPRQLSPLAPLCRTTSYTPNIPCPQGPRARRAAGHPERPGGGGLAAAAAAHCGGRGGQRVA